MRRERLQLLLLITCLHPGGGFLLLPGVSAFFCACDSLVLQVVCHGIPDQRPLQDGDIVNVDVTAYYKGFHGDLNETFVVGTVDEGSKKLIRTTSEVGSCVSVTC